MSVLLDTHAMLYWIDTSLGTVRPATVKIINEANTVWISGVTFYEIGQLARLQRIKLDSVPLNELKPHCEKLGFQIVDTEAHHYLAAATLDWENRDPFDRIIIAVAQSLNADIITKDRRIADFAASNPTAPRVIW